SLLCELCVSVVNIFFLWGADQEHHVLKGAEVDDRVDLDPGRAAGRVRDAGDSAQEEAARNAVRRVLRRHDESVRLSRGVSDHPLEVTLGSRGALIDADPALVEGDSNRGGLGDGDRAGP